MLVDKFIDIFSVAILVIFLLCAVLGVIYLIILIIQSLKDK